MKSAFYRFWPSFLSNTESKKPAADWRRYCTEERIAEMPAVQNNVGGLAPGTGNDVRNEEQPMKGAM